VTNPSPDRNPAKKPRLTFSIPGRPLSAVGEVGVAIRYLRAADPALAAVIDAHEPPVFQCPHRPFHSLVRSILYQQLAFKAAASVYSRFLALLGGESCVAPDAVLALTPHQLRQIGVSPRKASYLHDLARKYASGILSDAAIVNMDDRSLAAMLTMVKGIGSWSVHMFMIFSLARPDVLPSADLGVRKGVQMLYALEDVPRPSQMDKLCERWRPYRSVGAWYMWRLIESKVPQPAPAIPVGSLAFPSPDGQSMLQQQEQQQQQTVIQMIDPLQMLPGMG
jgi:DNA-3-methyladenine glycosylase II